jgi:rubrerythrin
MIDISKTSVRDLLGMAVRAEIDANKIYTDLAEKVSNPLLKEKFLMLAFEENKHRESLEKLFLRKYGEEEIPIPPKTDDDLLPSLSFTPSSPLVEILNQAMESERSAERFYAKLSLRVEDPYKKILEYLSHVEHSHYAMLRSEYLLAQTFEDYGEKDTDKVVT